MFLCGNFALKPLQIGEIMSNNKIMQFSYFYLNANEKKQTRKRPYFTMECAITGILRDASGKMHHGILFGRRLDRYQIFFVVGLRSRALRERVELRY